MGVKLDESMSNMKSGVYTFCAHGGIYHTIDQLVPKKGQPRYLQLYFYDAETELSHRLRCPNTNGKIIEILTRVLATNPYVETFRSLGTLGPLDNYRVTLNAAVELDKRVYNQPTTSEVAGIWVEGNDDISAFKRSIVVYGKSDNYESFIRISDDMAIPYSDKVKSMNALIDAIFPSLQINVVDKGYIISRAILSTKNESVDEINDHLIERFSGEEKVYYSFDEAEDDTNNLYPVEFLNSLSVSGLPLHYLRLKVGCPIILLRNIDPSNGLCNGTRLICKSFQHNFIDAEIAVGQHAGKRVFLPRIPLCPSEDDMFPFKLKRKQFPVRLSFAMTINKAQGQTIPNVGVYLPESVFSHDQLYVALSRGISRDSTKVLVKPVKEFDGDGVYTSNVVYKEVLSD